MFCLKMGLLLVSELLPARVRQLLDLGARLLLLLTTKCTAPSPPHVAFCPVSLSAIDGLTVNFLSAFPQATSVQGDDPPTHPRLETSYSSS